MISAFFFCRMADSTDKSVEDIVPLAKLDYFTHVVAELMRQQRIGEITREELLSALLAAM
jgi:hypothetical protein